MTPDVSMIGWMVILVGALSACLGLYLQVINTSEVPIRYSLGFYLFGTGFAMSHSSRYFAGDGPGIFAMQTIGVLIVGFGLVAAAWDLQRAYKVCGPVKAMREMTAEKEEEEEKIVLHA